jgi:hypothetical protein
MTAPLTERVPERRARRVSAPRDGSFILRIIAAIAAAVPMVLGLIAVARVSWSNGGFDAAPVAVAGMTFTPTIAVATLAIGVIGLLAAASRDRASKLVLGVVFICGAIAIFAVEPDSGRIVLSNNHAWVLGIVGVVFVIVSVLMSMLSRPVLVDDAV